MHQRLIRSCASVLGMGLMNWEREAPDSAVIAVMPFPRFHCDGDKRRADLRLRAISAKVKEAQWEMSCQNEKGGDGQTSEANVRRLGFGLNQPTGKKESSKFSRYSSRSARVNAVYNQRRNATSSSSSVR